jgi:uncharacterized protein YukE
MEYSVAAFIDMARALSQGDFDHEFARRFEGELGQLAAHIEALRQKLRALPPTAAHSATLLPQAARTVAQLSREADESVNSILGVVDEMAADQDRAIELLEAAGRGGPTDLRELRALTERSRRNLMCLTGFLSFQDVLRQRAEAAQDTLQQIEKRIVELLVKFKIKVNGTGLKGSGGQESVRGEVRDLSRKMGLDQRLVDELLAS